MEDAAYVPSRRFIRASRHVALRIASRIAKLVVGIARLSDSVPEHLETSSPSNPRGSLFILITWTRVFIRHPVEAKIATDKTVHVQRKL